MRVFLVALCVASLSLSSVAAARGGAITKSSSGVAAWLSKMKKVVVAGQTIGIVGAQDIGMAGAQDIGMAGAQDIGMAGAQDIGKEAGQTIGMAGAQDIGMAGAQDIGMAGAQDIGKEAGQTIGIVGAQDIGKEAGQTIGMAGAQDIGMAGAQDIGMAGAQDIGKEAGQTIGMAGAQDIGMAGAQDIGMAGQTIGKAAKAGLAMAVGIMVACGLQGCDPAQNLAKDVIEARTDSDNPVKIGVINEHEFPQGWKGAMLAAEQANRAGGIDGRLIVLVPQTIYGRSKSGAVIAAENLIEYDEVIAISGASYSTLSEFIDEVVELEDVPMVTIGSTNPHVTAASEWVFLAAFPDSFQARVMATLAREELGADTAAVLYWGADAYSKGLAGLFSESFGKSGGSVVANFAYTYEGNTASFATELNASGIIDEVVAAQPDVVFLPGFEADSGTVAKALRAAGEDAALLGADGWGSARDLVEIAGEAVEGALHSDHFAPEASPQFTAAYTSAYGIAPDGLAALGYDSVMIIIQAAQRAAAGGELTRTALRDEIEATDDYRGATHIIGYDENRHPVKDAVIFIIQDGERVFFETATVH